MKKISFLLMFAFICLSGHVFANLEEDIQEMQGNVSINRFDIHPLRTYLIEQVAAELNTLKSLPDRKDKTQKVLFWLHTGRFQAYKEILNTIEVLEQNS